MFHIYLGWIGAILFSICGFPQAIKTWKTKKAGDLSWLFLLMWWGGEVLTLFYILIDDAILGITHFPLYINYVINLIIIYYLIYAKAHY